MKDYLQRRNFFLRPEYVLLIVGLFIGLGLSIFIPYGAGFDEETHLVRIFDISGLHFIPNRGVENGDFTFAEFYTLSYQRRHFETPAFDQFDAKNFGMKANWQQMADGTTRSTYFPANYFLQAIVAGLFWRMFNFPILPVTIIMRLVGFAFYLFACYLTLKLLPTGKWVFLVIAFTPMALFQAATLNTDGFTIACSFLFIGVLLNVFLRAEKKIHLSDAWKIALVSVLVGCAKPGTILLLFLLIILIKHVPERKAVNIIIFAGIFLSLAISLGWMSLVVANSNIWTGQKTFSSQLGLVLANFSDFLKIYFKGIAISLKGYYTGWVGVYGYWVGQVPLAVYILFPLALLAAYFTEAKLDTYHLGKRLAIFLIGLVCLAGIASFQYIAGYTPGVQHSDSVGRYFLPFSSLVFLAFCGSFSFHSKTQKIARILTIGLIISTLVFYSLGIYRTYYTQCVYPVSAARPCTLPVYKNVDLNDRYVARVKPSQQVNQSFVSECKEIDSVKVRVQSVVDNAKDSVIFTVLSDNQHAIASQVFDLSGLKQDEMLTLPVQIKTVPGKSSLRLNLSLSPGDSPDADLGLLGRSGAALYPAGILLFNDSVQDGDLYFQYTCKNP